jgi:hypothetical protein
MYTTFHSLCNKKKIRSVCQKGINEVQTRCVRINVEEILKLSKLVPCGLNHMLFNHMHLIAHLVPV